MFGRSRVEPDPRDDILRRRLATFAAPGGPWEMKDMSVSGFRLLAPMSIATEVTLSMLVAMHRRGENSWVMGIVRRMRRLSADNAEIGLQLIANTLAAAELIEQRKPRDTDYSVDGEHDPLSGRRFRGLFLSFSRRAGEPAVQSLIVPPVEYQPSRRYTLQTSDRAAHDPVRPRCSSSTTDWVWTVIEPLEPDGAAATPALTGGQRAVAVDRYGEICAAHRWDVPARFNIAHACCARWADDRARFALYWEDESGARSAYTFWDLQQQANRLSNALAALGVGAGDKVALILPQRPETVVAHIAVVPARRDRGAAVVPVRPRGARVPAHRFRGQGRVRRSAVAAEASRRSASAAPASRAVDRRRRRARGLDHAVRHAASIAARDAFDMRATRRRPIRRSSSTRAARPARRRAR